MGEVSRTFIGVQVQRIAEQYNIQQNQVHNIILTYIYNCKLALLRGEVVDLYGFVRIEPDVITSVYEQTRGFFCYKIADAIGLPHNTVVEVIDAYIEDAIESLLSGVRVEFRGLFTCRPLRTEDGGYIVNTHISQSLRGMLESSDSPVSSFRLKTYKTLRDKVSKESNWV